MYSIAIAPAAPQGAAVRATATSKAAALAVTLARLDAQYNKPRTQATPPTPPPPRDYGPEVAARAALARTHSAYFDARAAHAEQPTPATAAGNQATRVAYDAASAAFFATPAGTRTLQARAAHGRPWTLTN